MLDEVAGTWSKFHIALGAIAVIALSGFISFAAAALTSPDNERVLWVWAGACLVIAAIAGIGWFFTQTEGGVMGLNQGDIQPNIHVESHGQQGGITVGVMNIQTESKPKIELSQMSHTEVPEGHLYEAILTVESTYALPALRITANAPSIQSLDVVPQRAGTDMSGHSGKRDGYHFTTLLNVVGRYRVRVITANPEQIRIDLE